MQAEHQLPSPWKEFLTEIDETLNEPLELHCVGGFVVTYFYGAWWQCVTEQGSRLACWLEVMRVLAASNPQRDCLFVALSGHELGMLGMDAYVANRQDLLRDAHAWIFFGSGIGTPQQPNLIHASDEGLEKWIAAALEREGITVNERAQHNPAARAEMAGVQARGGRFVTLVCDSNVYHSVADRWPEAVDVGLLARYARAFANRAVHLAQAEPNA